MKQLPPQILKDGYFVGIEKEINNFLYDLIFSPLIKIFKENGVEFKNGNNPLVDAIERGVITFEDGKFTGSFNSKTSKALRDIGAKFDARSKSWVLSTPAPPEVSIAAVSAAGRAVSISNRCISVLDGIDVPAALARARIRNAMGLSLDRMDADWQKSVKSVAIAPRLTPEQSSVIVREWQDNMDLYIKDWAEQNIKDLREKVRKNAFIGQRSDILIKDIQKTYGASKAKAKFLARQETSLVMSKLKEQRYKDNGITRYKWSTSHDERVRDRHNHLDGKIFSFDNPPIVDDTGRRANAGEDFGCRCICIPIVD